MTSIWRRYLYKDPKGPKAKDQQHFEQLYRRQAALARIELVIDQEEGLQRTLERICKVASNLLPASGGASIVLWDASTNDFVISASTVPRQTAQLAAERVRRTGGATQWIIENHQPVIVSDIRHDPFTANPMLFEFSNRAYAGMPLLVNREIVGVLYAIDRLPRAYTEPDLDFLEALANRAALAIEKIRLFDSVKAVNHRLAKEGEEKERVIGQLQKSLADVKTLRGIIPICASCKKIRDDEGDWQQLEVYITTRTDAEFSHSICPECVKPYRA